MSKQLPLLGGIAATLRWAEELVFLLSGPGLTVAAGIAVTNLMTHNAILSSNPWLLIVWGILTAAGVESQLVGTFDKLRQAVIRKQGWAIFGWLLLGLALGYVSFVSIEVFAYQQSQGLDEVQALAQLGISAVAWQWQRSLLSVGLVALAGFNRFRPEVKTLQDEKAELERELTLEPLRQQVREVKAVGAVNLTKSVAGAATSRKKTTRKPAPPTGGTPQAQPERPEVKSAPLPTARERVFKLLRQNPNLGKDALAKLANVSPSTAAKHKKEWSAEVREAMEQAA